MVKSRLKHSGGRRQIRTMKMKLTHNMTLVSLCNVVSLTAPTVEKMTRLHLKRHFLSHPTGQDNKASLDREPVCSTLIQRRTIGSNKVRHIPIWIVANKIITLLAITWWRTSVRHTLKGLEGFVSSLPIYSRYPSMKNRCKKWPNRQSIWIIW